MEDIILSSFYPIALLARMFGYFPFCNVGRRVLHYSQLNTCHPSCLDIFLSLFSFSLMAVSTTAYFTHWYVTVNDNLRMTIYNCFYAAYRINSSVIFLQFICFKQRSLIRLLQHLSRIQHLEEFRLRRKSLITLGYMLALTAIILSFIYGFGIDTYYCHSSPWERFFSGVGAGGQFFAYNLVTALVVYFNSVLRWHFIDLGSELNRMALLCSSLNFSKRLSFIRRRHERLIMLTEEFNDLLSPIFTFYMVFQSVSLCINSNELAMTIVKKQSSFFLVRATILMLIRLLPLMAVCLTSNALSQSADFSENDFNGCTFLSASSESKFQINMLFIQIKRRKATISADEFFTVDNRLLAEITSSIVTYIVVMLETDNHTND
ncbi:hypothetical protein CHUAL_003946 [Chamberlinius hualienensis]